MGKLIQTTSDRTIARMVAIFSRALLAGIFALTPAYAQNVTIQGKVSTSTGDPVAGSATKFRVQIFSPDSAAHCVLYDETHIVDLSQSRGLFSINLGIIDPARVSRSAPTTFSLEQVLSNRVPFSVPGTFCLPAVSGSATYFPQASDNRKVVIQFLDEATMGAGNWETIPEMDINPVAFAIEARNLGGFPADTILRVVNGAGTPAAATPFYTTEVTELHSLAGGVSNKYLATDPLAGVKLPSSAPSAAAAGSIWYDAGTLKYSDGITTHSLGTASAGAITGIIAGIGLDGGGNSGIITLDLEPSGVGTVPSLGSATTVPVIQVDTYGRITSASSIAIAGVAPSGAASGDLSGTFPSPTVAKIRGRSFSPSAPVTGQIYKFDDKGTGTAADDEFVPGNIFAADLKSTSLGSLLPGSCLGNQAWFFNSGTGAYECGALSNIATANLADYGAGANTYRSVSVDSKGRVTSGTNPTTLSAYGITDPLVANAGGALSLGAGSSRPSFGTAGRIYVDTTAKIISYDSGTAWIDIASGGGGTSFTGSLAGEVSGTQSATQVDAIGSFNRTQIATHLTTVGAATDANTPSALVKRDASGNFAAGTALINELHFKAGASNQVALKANAASATYSLQLPASAPANGESLQADSAGVLSWVTAAAGGISSLVDGTGISATGSGTTRTISLTNVLSNPGPFGSATQVPTFTADAQGRLTAAGNMTITGVAPGGTASGDLSGTYPAPTVAKMQGVAVSSASPNLDQVLKYGASTWAPATLHLNDLKDNLGTGSSVASAVCTPDKTMYYDVSTQSLKCTPISIVASSAISGTLPVANGGTGASSIDGAGIVDKASAQSIAGTKTFTSIISAGLQITGGAPALNKVLTSDNTGIATWQALPAGGLSSVGLTMPGIFTVGSSPLTANGTIAVTAAGTAGGIPYFNAANTMASSAALTQYGLVVGGGVAGAPAALAAGGAGTILTGMGSANPQFTISPTLGVAGASKGSLTLAGNTSGAVSIVPQAAAGTYNFNLPTAAGSVGQALLSGAGGASPMTFGTLGVGAGGTGLTAGTQGGIVYFNGTGSMASTSAGTAGQVLTSNGTGAPTWAAAGGGGGGDFKADGTVVMTGIMKASDGASGSPSIAIGSDLTTGFYKYAAGSLAFASGGGPKVFLDGTGIKTASALVSNLNAVGNPVFANVNEATTGLWFPAAGTMAFSTAGAERLRIDASGNVGIGITPGSEKLEVSGNVKATAFVSTSDRRLKFDIRDVEGLSLVNKMHGVRYRWKANGQPDVGVIAQEMEEILPEAVVTDANTGFKAVKYQNLISPIIEAVKELFGMAKTEEAKNLHQDRQISTLKAEIYDLKAQNERLLRSEEKLNQRLLSIENKLERR